jgi:hypothetical protein
VADHPDAQGAQIFAREQWAGISGMSVGTSINLATNVLPMTGIFLFLLDKRSVTARVTFADISQDVPVSPGVPAAASAPASRSSLPAPAEPDDVPVDLVQLAWARSGDKGQLFNVAVIARHPKYLSYLQTALSPDAVSEWYRHFGPGDEAPRVDRYEAPGFHALNFVIHDALVGGINASTRLDPAAKGMAQMLLRFPVSIPAEMAEKLGSATLSRKGI